MKISKSVQPLSCLRESNAQVFIYTDEDYFYRIVKNDCCSKKHVEAVVAQQRNETKYNQIMSM